MTARKHARQCEWIQLRNGRWQCKTPGCGRVQDIKSHAVCRSGLPPSKRRRVCVSCAKRKQWMNEKVPHSGTVVGYVLDPIQRAAVWAWQRLWVPKDSQSP